MAALDPTAQTAQNVMNGARIQPQYPAMPEVPENRPLLRSFGATGTAIFSGIITSEEYNPDFYWRDGIKLYEQMLRNDAQINATREMLELPIRRATWSIQPASDDARDQEIAAFVRACLFDEMRSTTASGRTQHQKWDDILRHILLHLSFGFMAFEVNWRIEDGFVKWARWTPLLPRTIWRWWVGADNELAGIQQWTFKDYSYVFVDIPADKLLLFAHRQEGNNFEGVSVFRSAYKHWWFKQNFERIDAIGIERNAVVPPVVHLPAGHSDSDVAAAQTIGQNMRVNEQMSVTLPFGWDVEYPKNQQRYAANTLQSIQYHDIMIARNVLAQFINLGSTETGAYSLDKSQVSTFLASLQAVCEYIEDVINNDAIRRLVDYNYDGVKNYPRLRCSKLTTQNIEALAQSLSQLASGNTPLLTPDATLEAWLREQFGIPAASPNPVDTENPGSPTTPQRPENQERADDHSDQQSQNVAPRAPGGGGRGGKNTGGGDASTAGAGGAGGGDAGGAAAAEADAIREEARLLRETLDAVYAGVDNVERGMVFFNPNHDRYGRFAPGGGMGGMGGGGIHASGGMHSAGHHEERAGSTVHGESHAGGGSHGGGHGGGGAGGSGGSGGGAKGGKTPRPKAAKTEKPTAEDAGKSAKGGRRGAKAAGNGQHVKQIATESIHVGLNPREHFDQARIDELASSIKENGLLQPISVRPHQNGYQIIAGERRFRAMKQLGYEHVPAIVRHVSDEQAHRLAIIENVNRVDMRPTETAKAYDSLMKRGMSVDEVAKAVGKSPAHVEQHLALLTMHPHIQKAVDEGQIPNSIVHAMSKLSAKGQEDVAARIIHDGIGVRSARALIRAKAAQEAQMTMFHNVKAPTHEQLDARGKYEDAVSRLTHTLHGLDDETMEHFSKAVDSPFREATRLDLMIKQLRGMQRTLQVEGHARDLAAAQQASLREVAMRVRETLAAAIHLRDVERGIRLAERKSGR